MYSYQFFKKVAEIVTAIYKEHHLQVREDLNQLKTVKDYEGRVMSAYEYQADGNLKTVTDANNIKKLTALSFQQTAKD